MRKRELRRFRKAAGRAMNKARRQGELSQADQITILRKMMDDDQVELMAAVCKAEAIKAGALTSERAAKGNIKWVGIGENIPWQDCFAFWAKILPMFL
jgi:hypothetical protein